MELKIISDTHNQHSKIPYDALETDVLIHCGDAAVRGTYEELKSFLDWFVKAPAKYKLYLPGNHDKGLKKNNGLKELMAAYGIQNPHRNLITINGHTFWGNEVVPYWSALTGKVSPSYITRYHVWRKMPENLDVLITHCPPRYILDLAARGEHLGCEQLALRIKDAKPRFHVFGHIHEHRGLSVTTSPTTYYNCSMLDPLNTHMRPDITEIIL